MAFKLALSAGHYLYTAGKRCKKSIDPNETREWWLNNRIADRIEVLLSEYDGIEILRLDDTTGKKDITLRQRSDAANNWKADFYLAVHHNAGVNGGKGGGISIHVYLQPSTESLEWQKELYNTLIQYTGLKGNRSNPLVKQNLHECREPKCPAVLMELGFMDSTTDVPIILTEDYAYKCAKACVDVIVKRKGLKKKSVTNNSTKVGTYKLVTSVNKYKTAADAVSKTGSTGTYKAGTYYIYTKYPNGVNGMFNITTDATGKEPGAWINPTENKVSTPVVEQLYRVRKSKDDAKSQVGAFSVLENAKEACDKAGTGYHVFDNNFNIVYSYKAPVTENKPVETPKVEEPKVETPKQEEVKITPVYDLDYKIKTKIVDKEVAIPEYVRKEQCLKAIKLIQKNNKDFDENIALAFYQIAYDFSIDANMAIAQSILETGWFKFEGSAVIPDQHNYCGLGVTSNGVKGPSFETPMHGVVAQLQHLYAYGCKDELPKEYSEVLDPRFKYVTRGIAPYWQNLAGRWAVPGYDKNKYDSPEKAMNAENTYGQKIYNLAQQILKVEVSKEEFDDFWGYKEPEVTEPQPQKPVDTTINGTVTKDPVIDENPETTTITESEKKSLIEWIVATLKLIADIIFKLFNK